MEETAAPPRLVRDRNDRGDDVLAARDGLTRSTSHVRDDAHLARYIATRVDASAKRFSLSAREAEVLALLVLGDSNAEIAEPRYVSHKTFKNHLGAIYERMGVLNRVEAATVTLLHALPDGSVPSVA
jgi:DNA-binding CsgD family transcriptional regulator